MSRQLTPRSNLDSLKKEAKQWLSALRANDPEALTRFQQAYPQAPPNPTLRDVQHALALEHGLTGWNALKNRLTGTTLQQYEEMVQALLEAYRTGTPAAMERHWKHTWHRRRWEAMRTYVQLDLGKRPESPDQEVIISLADARLLIAREHGFQNWQALTEYVAALPAKPGKIAPKPVTLLSVDDTGEQHVVACERDWDAILNRMKEQTIPALNAEGQMTNDALNRLSRLDHITSLNLNGSKQLTDAGLRHLARLPRLQHLDISGTAITDRALEVLRHLPELKTIRLARTAVSDTGLASLAYCPNLEQVDVSGTRSGDDTIKALTGKPNLHHFRSGNEVTDAGLPLLHAFPVFKTWQGGEAQMALLRYDAGPNHLSLRGCFTDAGLAELSGLDGLCALNLDDRQLVITAAGLAPLVTLPNLGWLAFDATDEAMPIIAEMPKLRFLMCQDTEAGDDGFVALSRSQSIEYIWGRRCYNLRTRGFTALAEMPALRALSVSCKNVEDAGLSVLPRFPALRELMPMDVPDEGYRHIGRCARLEALILMYCRDTTDRATEHIVGLHNLKRYFASYTKITDRTPELLSTIPSLEQIEFSTCAGLTNNGITALARLPRLRELRVDGVPSVTSDIAGAFPASTRVTIGV